MVRIGSLLSVIAAVRCGTALPVGIKGVFAKPQIFGGHEIFTVHGNRRPLRKITCSTSLLARAHYPRFTQNEQCQFVYPVLQGGARFVPSRAAAPAGPP
jgi:hypothetical protein